MTNHNQWYPRDSMAHSHQIQTNSTLSVDFINVFKEKHWYYCCLHNSVNMQFFFKMWHDLPAIIGHFHMSCKYCIISINLAGPAENLVSATPQSHHDICKFLGNFRQFCTTGNEKIVYWSHGCQNEFSTPWKSLWHTMTFLHFRQKVPYFESPPLHTVHVSTYPDSSFSRDAEHGQVSSLPSTRDCFTPLCLFPSTRPPILACLHFS